MCRAHAVCWLYIGVGRVDQRATLLFSPAFWNISSVSTSRSLKGSLVCSRSALACSRCRTSVAVVRLIFSSRAIFAEDLPCSTSRRNRTVCSGVKYLPSNTVPLYRLYMPRHTLHRYTSRSLFFVLRNQLAWSRSARQCGHFNPSGWKYSSSHSRQASRSISSVIGKSMPHILPNHLS